MRWIRNGRDQMSAAGATLRTENGKRRTENAQPLTFYILRSAFSVSQSAWDVEQAGQGLMPLYEYKCDSCGATFEVIQRVSDPPIRTCRACGGPVHKVLSPPAIQFRGAGWYVTDYARKGKTEAEKPSEGKTPSPQDSGKTSGSPSTPASTDSTSTDKPKG